MEKEKDTFELSGTTIAGPNKVKFRSLGGGNEGITIKKPFIDALRLKVNKIRYLTTRVIMDEHGRRILIVEIKAERKQQ